MENTKRDIVKHNQLNVKGFIRTVDTELDELVSKSLNGDKEASIALLERRKNRANVTDDNWKKYIYIAEPAIVNKYKLKFGNSPLFSKLFLGDVYADGTAVVDASVLISLSS